MNDLASLAGKPKPLLVDGREYAVYPLTIDDLADLQAWCDRQCPDPIEAVAKHLGSGKFNPVQEKYLLRMAVEVATAPRPKIGSPETQAMIGSLEGCAMLLWLSIRKGDPGFSEEAGKTLAKKIGVGRVHQVIEFTGADMVASDPKATKPGATD